MGPFFQEINGFSSVGPSMENLVDPSRSFGGVLTEARTLHSRKKCSEHCPWLFHQLWMNSTLLWQTPPIFAALIHNAFNTRYYIVVFWPLCTQFYVIRSREYVIFGPILKYFCVKIKRTGKQTEEIVVWLVTYESKWDNVYVGFSSLKFKRVLQTPSNKLGTLGWLT